jgi:hypothetical protein
VGAGAERSHSRLQIPIGKLPVAASGNRQARQGQIGGEHLAENTNPPRRRVRVWSGWRHITTV